MITMEAVRKIMELKGVRVSVLCDRLGLKSNVLCGRFTQKNVSVSVLNEMLRAMDYKVVIVPRETRIPEGGFEIE